MRKRRLLGFILVAVVTVVTIGLALVPGRNDAQWKSATAEVTGFGGPGSRRGSVDVYLKNSAAYGVIQNVRADQLNCRVGQKVEVEQAGRILRGLPETCRAAAKLPGQIL